MSIPIFKFLLKKHWVLIVVFTLILVLYSSFAVTTYDPTDAAAMEEMLQMLPSELIEAFGWSDLGSTYTEYVAAFLYGFIMVVFPLVLFVLLANALVAKPVDSGSIAYLLASPNARSKIIFTKALFLFGATSFAYWVATVYTVILSQSMQGGLLNLGQFFSINAIVYLVMTMLAAISFFCACAVDNHTTEVTLVAGVPVAMVLISMLQQAAENLSALKYLTLFSLIDFDAAFYQSGYTLVVSLALAGATVLFYALSILAFNKRSLAI